VCGEGLRPEINKNTAPANYFRLAKQCLDADPTKRPTFDKLDEILCFWYDSLF
ncbi:9801_t:CDS:1, partial [Entrophospora sp. SA101]